MKKFFLIFSIIIEVGLAQAQPQSSWMYFGYHAGMHAVGNGFVCDTSGKLGAIDKCATISDGNGNLLFYTNGYFVWNRNHQLMPNGDTLFLNSWWPNYSTAIAEGCRGGVLILQFDSNQYDVFIKIAGWIFNGVESYDAGYYWYKVDMNLNGGLGDVVGIPQYINIPETTFQPIGCVKHANGRDWWVIGHEAAAFSTKYIKFLVSPSNIYGPFYQDIGGTRNSGTYLAGQCSFSNDGSKFISGNSDGELSLFDFDRCSGELSNYKDLSGYFGIGSIEEVITGSIFSPDGGIVYFNNQNYLFQIHDISDAGFIRDTIMTNPQVFGINDSIPVTFGNLCIVNDKILVTLGSNTTGNSIPDSMFLNLTVINLPNNPGLACDINPLSISTCGKKTWASLPYFPNWNLGPIDGSACDTLGIDNGIGEQNNDGNELGVYPNPADDEINISTTISALKNELLIITDVQGRVVYKNKSFAKSQTINIKSFASGVYFIKMQTQTGAIQVKKFVKN